MHYDHQYQIGKKKKNMRKYRCVQNNAQQEKEQTGEKMYLTKLHHLKIYKLLLQLLQFA